MKVTHDIKNGWLADLYKVDDGRTAADIRRKGSVDPVLELSADSCDRLTEIFRKAKAGA